MTTDAPLLGFPYVPNQPPERLRTIAHAVETAGLDQLWVWEDCFKQSAIASASAALAWTRQITVGIGLMPVPLRNVALTAMEVAALSRMFPGRIIAGVGHGVQSWMEQAGVRVDSPVTLLREYVRALRSLLSGERVTCAGRYVRLADVALDWPPSAIPPLYIGGQGPRTLSIAGSMGDGVLLGTAMTVDEVRSTLAQADHAEFDAGRLHPHAPRGAVAVLNVATGPHATERLAAERTIWGRPADANIGVAGGAHEIARAILELRDAGATSVVIQPTSDETDILGFIECLGKQVKPLLRVA